MKKYIRKGSDIMNKHSDTATRLSALREELARHNVDGFYIPRADQFQNEYVPACNNRLEYITGFAGSAGSAIVLKETAAFFTDGRYTIQAQEEVSKDSFEIYSTSPDQEPTPTRTPSAWLGEALSNGAKIGFDPWIMTPAQYDQLHSAVKQSGGELIPLAENPIDTTWSTRPEDPKTPVVIHPLDYAGVDYNEKIKDMCQTLAEHDCTALTLTFPEEICWLLNIRGSDVEYNPLVLCYAILSKDGHVDLFIDSEKIDQTVTTYFSGTVTIHDFQAFAAHVNTFTAEQKIWFDPETTPFQVKHILNNNNVPDHPAQSPIQMAKARKNITEMEGAIQAHIRDGVALSRFLYKLSQPSYTENATELSAANDLHDFRRSEDLFKDLSFETISGAGPAGAIIHYRVTPNSDKPLHAGPLYLVDSGGQYLDGTTDVTRTVSIEQPTAEMIDRYTRVLKGHIQVAMSHFPAGTTGADLDVKARAALKEVGLNYAHGTGHGVGSYLCVHEGPCGIHHRAETPLEPGMIVSNEPGYYQPGSYGIRIENLIMVMDSGTFDENDIPVYCFKTLTLAPIDLKCVDAHMLTLDEKIWLNSYHANVREQLMPFLQEKDSQSADWVEQATQSL